jgi:uncharacterized membrane protein (UPF0182 family)
MTAWMAGQSDASGGARLLVYRFPRQTTVFGPQQVEARINQDPEISTQITLLNTSGSRMIRGNMLVIPVEESVIYVQPVYLQATGSAVTPTELKFVIVATSTQVEMRPTLEKALQAVAVTDAEEGPKAASANVEEGASLPGSESGATASAALAVFQQGQQALRDGDWATYGEAQAELRTILEGLAFAETGAPTGGPAPEATTVP